MKFFDSDHAYDTHQQESPSPAYLPSLATLLLYGCLSAKELLLQEPHTAEVCAARTTTEEAMGICFILLSLSVPIKSMTLLLGKNMGSLIIGSLHAAFSQCAYQVYDTMLGKNMGSLISGSNLASVCSKKHCILNYHMVKECVVLEKIQLANVNTKLNFSDSFLKAVDKQTFTSHGPKQCFQ